MKDQGLSIKGFTLVELIVVISLIAVLALGVISITNPVLQFQKVRDSKRKFDLKQITTLLNLYYNDHGKFPPAGSCAGGTQCNVSSISGTGWIPALVPQYAAKIPVDPVNTADKPWITGNYSYSYGNVSLDGQTYDLTTQLENPSDSDRCELKNYTFGEGFGPSMSWCTAFGGSFSNQIYEYSPPF